MAVPDRPATASAVTSGPSSRTITTTIRVPSHSVLPMDPSSRAACEITRKLRMLESRTMRATACTAVKRIWFMVTRNATARPATGRVTSARRAPKPKRASAPNWESRRATMLPRRPMKFTGGSALLLLLQAFLRRDVIREDVQRGLVHLDGLLLVAAVMIEERAGVEGQRLGRDGLAHALGSHVLGQGREAGVFHQALRHVRHDAEQLVLRRGLRLRLHDFGRLDVDQPDVEAPVGAVGDERPRHRVLGPDDLADLRGSLRIHAARGVEILLVGKLLDLLALHHAPGVIRLELVDHHPREATLQGRHIRRILHADGSAIFEGEDGDARTGDGPRGLLRDCAPRETDQGEQGQHRTRTHRVLLGSKTPVGTHNVSCSPSRAARTSPGPPSFFASLRAAARTSSIAPSECSGS